MKTKPRVYAVAEAPVRFSQLELDWLAFIRYLLHAGYFRDDLGASAR